MNTKRKALSIFLPLLMILSALLCACTSGTAISYAPDTQDTPGESIAAFSFLYFSDTQADPEAGDYSAVGALIADAVALGESPALAVFGGDTVDDGGDASEWAVFWQALGASLDGMATAAGAGNHDSHALLASQFDYPHTAPAGQGDGFFYSFDMGGVHFLMLDSNIMGAGRQQDIDWLREDLESSAASSADWRIAVLHHPLWPVVANPKDEARAATMREHFLPLLEAGGVDLVLCGHQHVYTRTLAMSGDGASADGTGIVQLMAASGAKQSYILGDTAYVAADAQAPVYLRVEADESALTVVAYDESHSPIDTYTIQKPSE